MTGVPYTSVSPAIWYRATCSGFDFGVSLFSKSSGVVDAQEQQQERQEERRKGIGNKSKLQGSGAC